MGMNGEQVERNISITGSRIAGNAGLFTRTFNRIFSRHMLHAVLLALLVLNATGNLTHPADQFRDPGLWWHLADARILTTTHRFIHVEPYSFTVAGERWINPEWLSEMPFWLGYRSLGLRGIFLVTVTALCANILFVYWRSYRKALHAGAAFWTAILAFMLMTINAGPRTIVIAYLAMSAEMAILEAAERGKKHLLWLLPPLFCVWINLHGSWIIGLGLLALYILCGLFPFSKGILDQEAYSSKDRQRLLLVFFAGLAALLINPYGWRLIWNPFDMLLNQRLMMSYAAEWHPLTLGTIAGLAAWLAIGLTLIANCVSGRKWKLYELAFLFFAWFEAINHCRFTFMASVIAIPLLAGDVARSFCAKPNEKTIPLLNALFVAGAVGVILFFFPSEASLQNSLAAEYPLQTIASIQPSWRTYDQGNLGGMMAFNSKPTFWDTRFDTFVHHGVLRDLIDIETLHAPLQLLDKYRIDHVLISESWALAYLLERTPGWRVERREGAGDDAYVLLARTPGATGDQSQCAAAPAQGKQ
jgi:hypothetical protein